ncbi:MAG: alpha/beta fold hydrolase [Desulfatibacillaceae bacterium]
MEFEPEKGVVEVDGADVEYLRWPGEGPPLVMLHATGFLPWLWLPVASGLEGRFDVYAPYFCDHRDADPHEGGLSWAVLARDLVDMLGGMGIRRPMLTGHSMGGTVAALATAAYGLATERMVLIEPIFLPDPAYTMDMGVDDHPLASRSIRRRNSWEDRRAARDYLKSKRLFASWDEEMLDLYVRYGMVSGDGGGLTLACQPGREAALFMGSRHMNPWPLLPDVSCPTLILEGETSENRSFIDLGHAASLMPDARHHMVQGAGHLVPMEKPGEVARLLLEFL